MHKSFVATASVVVISALLIGCGSGDDNGASPDGSPGPTADAQADVISTGDVGVPPTPACPVVVSEADCDKTLRPFVFVHGTYGSGDNFAHVASLLTSNGYCPDHIVAVEYNSLGDQPGNDCTAPNMPQGCGKIDAAVNAILQKFPQFTQVDIAGHSQGTAHCGTYIGAGGVGAHADKIAHYVNFSGIPDVGNVQTLSLSSQHDLMNTPHHATGTSVCTLPFPDADGGTTTVDASADATVSTDAGASADAAPAPSCNVKQVTFIHQDHFAVAASTDSFIQLYRYLNGTDPKYTEIQCGDDPVTIVGLSETFADNTPVTGKIEVREVSATPRSTAAPDMVITGNSTGIVGCAGNSVTTPDGGPPCVPVQLKRGAYYEFAGFDATGKLIGYQYFTPFKRSNYLVRFLTPASMSDGSGIGAAIAAQSTDHFVRSPNFVDIVARWAGGAFRQDLGASLTIDGNEVLSSANAGADAFATANLGGGVVGLFMYDGNKNGKTDLGLLTSGPFLSFTDVFVDAKTPKLVELSLTPGSEEPASVGNKIVVSNWPSDGALLNVMFQ